MIQIQAHFCVFTCNEDGIVTIQRIGMTWECTFIVCPYLSSYSPWCTAKQSQNNRCSDFKDRPGMVFTAIAFAAWYTTAIQSQVPQSKLHRRTAYWRVFWCGRDIILDGELNWFNFVWDQCDCNHYITRPVGNTVCSYWRRRLVHYLRHFFKNATSDSHLVTQS